MKRDRKFVVIGRGQASWHADLIEDGNKCSSSGGSLENYLSEAANGTPVYDASDADGSAFIDWVFHGPMIDVFLEPGHISKFGDHETLLGMLPALKGGFDTLAVMTLAEISSLDYVAVDVYLTMLREKVPGVRFGVVQNKQVVWE